MIRRNGFFLWGIALVVLLLSGCQLARSNNGGDIEADAFVAPAAAGASTEVAVATEVVVAAEVAAAAEIPAAQDGAAIIRLQPASQSANVGNFGNVQIWVDNVANLYGLEIQLLFDPALIQIEDADTSQEGVQIQHGGFLSPDLVATNQVDNATGTISYIVTQTSPSPPVGGSGIIATFTFQAVAAGTTNLNFITVKLANSDGQQIPANIQSGQIIIGDSGQPVVTPTPTATTPPVTPGDTPTPTPTLIVLTLTPTLVPTLAPTPTPPPTTTPLPPNMNIPPGATVGFCYRVQLCETLACVGQKFGVDPHYLNLVNDLNPPGHIFTHQALFIPEVHGQGPNVYIVKEGDTMVAIADACHLPIDFLTWANCLPEDVVLQPGHVLEIPIPPFSPPSRHPYEGSVSPSVTGGCKRY